MKHVIFSAALALSSLALAQLEFRAIPIPNPQERVTAVYCSSATACVIATDSTQGGAIYASDGQKITATLVKGDGQLSQSVGVLGGFGFTGFSKVGDRLIALTANASSAFVSAKGDITQAASWSVVKIGVAEDEGLGGLNQQMGIGSKDGRWVHFIFAKVYESTDGPSAGALWVPTWSPFTPSTPRDFAALRRAEPKLCEAEPGVRWSPKLTQPAYVAPDLSVIVYPSGARNQKGSSAPGVCLSTDGGKRFFNIPFTGQDGDLGPLGVSCLDAQRCFAYGGLDYEEKSAFIFYTTDAQNGAASSWARAKLPTLRPNTGFRGIGFAPDGRNGWAIALVDSSNPALYYSPDGGANWQDVSTSIRALVQSRVQTVYAFDATRVWIGGERGLLLTSGK